MPFFDSAGARTFCSQAGLLLCALAGAGFAAGASVRSARLPVHFEPNLGQAPGDVRFLARGGGLTALFERDAVRVSMVHSEPSAPVEFTLQIAGGRAARFTPQSLTQGVSAYFRGNDPSQWIPCVPQYSSLLAEDVYDGVDVRYYDSPRQQRSSLEFDFLVKPHADPRKIRMRFPDAAALSLNAHGGLLISTDTGAATLQRPVAYQDIRGRRVKVQSRYEIAGRMVRIRTGRYDHSHALVIDPVLVYSTLLGSGEGAGIAVDAAGAAYVTGWTAGQFVNARPLSGATSRSGSADAFVTKLMYGPGNLLQVAYSTYLGGSGADRGAAIVVDAAGTVYLTGRTSSQDFPIVNPLAGGAQLTSPMNAFIAKLSFNAATRALSLDYSTFLGAGAVAFGRGIAIDSSGAAYVTGGTIALPQAAPFPVRNPLAATGGLNQGAGDAFVVKAAQPQGGTALELVYSTLLGGAGDDEGLGIAVSASGTAYVTGRTVAPAEGTPFPVVNALAGQTPAGSDAFVAKLGFAAGALSLGYSTLLGGESTDEGRAIALDSQESAYVAGYTLAPFTGRAFPTVNALPGGDTNRGGEDAFTAKIAQSVAGKATLVYSTLLGGAGNDQARGIAVDTAGSAHIAGETGSTEFPVVNPLAESVAPFLGSTDAFVARLVFNAGSNALSLHFSTFIGGDGPDVGRGIAVDLTGSIYVTGESARGLSRGFPFARPLAPNGGNYLDGSFNVFAVRISHALLSGGKRLTVNVTGTGNVRSVVPEGQIDCPSICSAVLDVAASLAATPAEGHLFSGWGDVCSGAGRCDVTMDADRTVTALFTAGAVVFVSRYGSGSGMVRGADVDCGATCRFVYRLGMEITLTAVADPGSVFTGWSGVCTGFGTGACTFLASENVSVVANFARVTGGQPGLHFFPLATPCRIADTRLNDGAFGKPAMTALETRSFVLPGRCGIPPNANAYALNVTVVPKGPLAYLTIFPAGQALPVVSTLNSLDGRIKANAAIVPAGVNGGVSVYVTNPAEVILDINGYFAPPGPGGLPYFATNPCRLMDTRNAGGPWGGPIMAPLETRSVPVYTSACAIPTVAAAYSLNVTVVPSGPLAYLTVWPSGPSPQPTVSTLNALTGTVTANAAIVPAGTAGENGGVRFYSTNRTTLVVDINGYFGPMGVAGNPLSFYPVAPCRVLDTRSPAGPSGGPILTGQQTREVQPALANCGIPANARAYSLNATVVPTAGLGYLTLWPAGLTVPTVSTLNATDGSVVSNAAIVPAGMAGAINLFASNTTHLILDISGYFAP